MRKYYDRITFYACLLVIAVCAFVGGFITAAGIIILIWRAFI